MEVATRCTSSLRWINLKESSVNLPSSHHPGARWIKAALQVNPFGYDGRSAPSKAFPDADAYDKAILNECDVQGIQLIAVTDHWCVDTARSLVDAASTHGIVAQPGFEANSSEGIHLHVLFEYDNALAASGCGARF